MGIQAKNDKKIPISKKVKFTTNHEKGAHGEFFFCDSGWIILPDDKILGVRAPRPRAFFFLSEVTTTKSALFKMVKIQKSARAARLNAGRKTWDI